MRKTIGWTIAILSAIPLQTIHADLITRQTAPYVWAEPLMPEKQPPPEYREYFDALDKARVQLAAGQYKRVLVTVRGAEKADAVETAVLKGQALKALGRLDEATTTLSSVNVVKDPRVVALHGDVLVEQGKPADAVALLTPVVTASPQSLVARLSLAEAQEAAGDMAGALKTYAWFAEPPQDFLNKWAGNADSFDNAADVTTIATALDRWASLSGAYRMNVSLHDTIYGMFTRAYDVIDRGYDPARVRAAAYAMSHDEDGDARQLLQQVLSHNPRDIAAADLMGRLMIGIYSFDAVDSCVGAIRSVDDDSAVADLLEARSYIQQQRPKEAEPCIRQVLAKKPNDLEALGLLAACYAAQRDDGAVKQALATVEKIDPDNATAYFEVGEASRSDHRMDFAVSAYRTAIDRAPNWTDPRNGLGLALAQTGDEVAARNALDAAHTLDPFNLKTTNYLRVLDDMQKFAQRTTDHFVFRYDAVDEILIDYVAEYMEKAFGEVTADMGYTPKVKTYVEIFPTADAFSVRTSGQMGIESFGVSMGSVVTTVAPRKGQTLGQFNWARVLRHEFTHTVNLAQTDFRCPRWLTEGLAVWEERVDYRFPQVPKDMYAAAMENRLLPIKDLGRYFLRPDRRINGEVAYMQGLWIALYLRETHGPDSIVKLLNAYRDNKDDAAAFKTVTGDDLPTFESKFFAWAKKRVEKWGYDKETIAKVKDMSTQADALVKAGATDEAIAMWTDIQKLQPMDSMPHRRLAGLYLRKKDNASAVPHLVALLPLELKDNRFAKRVARICRDAGKMDDAIHYATQAVYVEPYDIDAHKLLAELAEKTGDAKTVEREQAAVVTLQKLAEEKPDDEKSVEKPAEKPNE